MPTKYDVAISFAGPQRDLARNLASLLRSKGLAVFFDEEFEHELLGTDGADYLNGVFLRDSRFCVALISSEYEGRSWAQLERRAAQARELTSGPGSLIPVLVDDVRPKWLLPTRIYFDLKKKSLDRLVDALRKKIAVESPGEFVEVFQTHELGFTDCHVTALSNDEEFLIWSTDHEKQEQLVTRLYPVGADWKMEPLSARARGEFVVSDGRRLLTAPERSSDQLLICCLETGKVYRHHVPRQARCNSVTDCVLLGSVVLVAYCTGDVWAIELYDRSSACIRPSRGEICYTYADFGPDGTVFIGDETGLIEERSLRRGELLSSHTASQGGRVRYFACVKNLLVAGHYDVTVYLMPGWKLVRRFETWGAYMSALAASKRRPYFGFVSGMASKVASIYDVEVGRVLLSLPSRFQVSWNSIALSPAGLLAAVAGDDTVTVFEQTATNASD